MKTKTEFNWNQHAKPTERKKNTFQLNLSRGLIALCNWKKMDVKKIKEKKWVLQEMKMMMLIIIIKKNQQKKWATAAVLAMSRCVLHEVRAIHIDIYTYIFFVFELNETERSYRFFAAAAVVVVDVFFFYFFNLLTLV